jgi:hypothetical protein
MYIRTMYIWTTLVHLNNVHLNNIGTLEQCTFGQCAFGQCTFGQCTFGQCTFGQFKFGQCTFGQKAQDSPNAESWYIYIDWHLVATFREKLRKRFMLLLQKWLKSIFSCKSQHARPITVEDKENNYEHFFLFLAFQRPTFFAALGSTMKWYQISAAD